MTATGGGFRDESDGNASRWDAPVRTESPPLSCVHGAGSVAEEERRAAGAAPDPNSTQT